MGVEAKTGEEESKRSRRPSESRKSNKSNGSKESFKMTESESKRLTRSDSRKSNGSAKLTKLTPTGFMGYSKISSKLTRIQEDGEYDHQMNRIAGIKEMNDVITILINVVLKLRKLHFTQMLFKLRKHP